MKWRLLETKDYLTLVGWWTIQKFRIPDLDDLPITDGAIQGIMVYEDGVELCAGFIIDTNVKNGALIEYVVANFDVKDRLLRKEALNYLIEALSEIAKAMGKKYLFTTVKVDSLIERYEECGFQKGSTNVTEMIKRL